MAVQCPRCELMFESKNEVSWHLREDHDWRAPTLDDPRARGSASASERGEGSRDGPGPRRNGPPGDSAPRR